MRFWKRLFWIGLLVIFSLPFVIAQEKVTLEYKFKEGQTLYMLVAIQGQVSIQLPESVQQEAMSPAFPISMALIVSQKTLKVYSDGAADMEYKFVDGKIYMMGQEISLLEQQQQLPQTIRLRIGKKGNIIKLLTPISTQQAPGIVGIGFDPNMFINNLSQVPVLPEQEVGIGDKWELKMDIDLAPLGKFNILSKMSLTGFEKVGDRNCAKIAIDVPPFPFQLNIPMAMPGAVPQEQEVPTLPMNGQMEMKGDMLFDYQNGYMVSQTGRLKMIMNMVMPAPGAQEMASQLTTNIDMKFKISPLEKKPQLPTPTQIQQIFQPPQQEQT